MHHIQRIAVKSAQLGEGFTVARALPTRQRRMVGAWCFLDHLGPAALGAGQGLHVGAHPHTCLQTFTWMIDGRILHRDSLGSEQVIEPGQVNLMTAGRGVVHTEDSLPGVSSVHAAQLWIALPAEHADIAPAFDHYADLPMWRQGACAVTVLAGEFAGARAPTRLYSPLVGLDIASGDRGRMVLALRADFEYGLLPLAGQVRIGAAGAGAQASGGGAVDGQVFGSDAFAWLGQGRTELPLELDAHSRCLLLGGAPFADPISMWWNFVAPSKGYIAQAQADWEAGAARFGRVMGDEGRRLTAPKLPWSD